MDLVRQVLVSASSNPIEDAIKQVLIGLSHEEAMKTLITLINTAMQYDEQMAEIASTAWSTIVGEELWKGSYNSQQELEQILGFKSNIEPLLKRCSATEKVKLQYLKAITAYWKTTITEAIPQDLHPRTWSRVLLAQLKELAKMLSKEDAVTHLREQVAWRIANSHRMQGKGILTIKDVQNVIEDLYRVYRVGDQARPQREIEGSHVGNSQDRGSGEEQRIEEPSTKNSSISPDNGIGEGRQSEESGRQNPSEGSEERSDVERARSSTPRQRVIPTRSQQVVGQRIPIKKRLQLKQISCDNCHPACLQFIAVIPRERVSFESGIEMLERTQKVLWMNFCKNHMRRLAAACGNLCNNKDCSKTELNKRMKYVLRYKDRIQKLERARPGWFRKDAKRQLTMEEILGPYNYNPQPLSEQFRFDAKEIFNRYAKSPNAWQKFQENGTINIDRFFDYIVAPEVFGLIEEEFDVYKYHLRNAIHGNDHRGWMRHMFYSLIQQLIRQDPAYWAILAAARPDKCWRLISYPYYTKDTTPGDNTGFMHFDINVEEFLETGRGGNVVQGSVSLDDEDNRNATILRPGFQRQLRAWWTLVKKRGLATSGYTTNAQDKYTAEDSRKFGNLIPVPCKRGAIRITKPEVVHGSTKKATRRRRTVFVWHSGIQDDHETLDVPEAEKWSDLVKCHQGFIAPHKSTSGEGFRYGRPGFTFPGAVKLSSTSMVGDAMVGARRWDDPQVLAERDILLGPDAEVACAQVRKIRQRLVNEYKKAFQFMREAEMRAFGDKSFYHVDRSDPPPPDKDLASDISEISSDEHNSGSGEEMHQSAQTKGKSRVRRKLSDEEILQLSESEEESPESEEGEEERESE
ncbi:hypothetical protein GP486_002201 [Trichoglossum hirsutum]|uniref:Uncharacterized protein n=1 Tax=Trichoglossum hirsutum TaxID=265104 RepID=A0A9P8LF77_9PEZI|nr:hypothetical protein GP486_002201 [Trichoglossum hirsutum]